MNRIRKAGFVLLALFSLGLASHESNQFYRYGHFAPLGLHADVVVTTSNELLGVEGTGKIYEASLTNYGVFPTTIVVCDCLDYASLHRTMLNYIVERREPQSNRWQYVPEWDDYGSRLFCRPSFEVTATHLVRRRLWPGQKIRMGGGVPAQWGGFRVGDDGRFTIFLEADGNGLNTLSTVAFRVDQELNKRGVRVPKSEKCKPDMCLHISGEPPNSSRMSAQVLRWKKRQPI